MEDKLDKISDTLGDIKGLLTSILGELIKQNGSNRLDQHRSLEKGKETVTNVQDEDRSMEKGKEKVINVQDEDRSMFRMEHRLLARSAALAPPQSSSQYCRLEIEGIVGDEDQTPNRHNRGKPGTSNTFIRGNPLRIKVIMKIGDEKVSDDHPLANVKAQLVVLDDGFYIPGKDQHNSHPRWPLKDFTDHFMYLNPKDPTRRRRMVVEKGEFRLNAGRGAPHQGATINDNSQKKPVKLGVMVHPDCDEIVESICQRVLEGVSNSFYVKEPPRVFSAKKENTDQSESLTPNVLGKRPRNGDNESSPRPQDSECNSLVSPQHASPTMPSQPDLIIDVRSSLPSQHHWNGLLQTVVHQSPSVMLKAEARATMKQAYEYRKDNPELNRLLEGTPELYYEQAADLYYAIKDMAPLAYRYECGHSLVEPDEVKHLTTYMRNLHEYYMAATKLPDPYGFEVVIPPQIVFYYEEEQKIGVEWECVFQLFQKRDLDSQMLLLWTLCVAKMSSRWDKLKHIGFLDPTQVNQKICSGKDGVDLDNLHSRLLYVFNQFLLSDQSHILLAYQCDSHFVFIVVNIKKNEIEVWDSKKKPYERLDDLLAVLNTIRRFQLGDKHVPFKVVESTVQHLDQPFANNECGFYVMWAMLMYIGGKSTEADQLREKLKKNNLLDMEIKALQEELAKFILDEVLSLGGSFSIAQY